MQAPGGRRRNQRRLRPRRLVVRLLGRRHGRGDGRGHGAVRPAPRPQDLRDLRRPLAAGPTSPAPSGPEQATRKSVASTDARGGVEQLDPARGRRRRGGRGAQARGGARRSRFTAAPTSFRRCSSTISSTAPPRDLPGRARDRQAALRRRRRPGRVGSGLSVTSSPASSWWPTSARGRHQVRDVALEEPTEEERERREGLGSLKGRPDAKADSLLRSQQPAAGERSGPAVFKGLHLSTHPRCRGSCGRPARLGMASPGTLPWTRQRTKR